MKKTIRIDNLEDVQAGDLVYFDGDPIGYPFMLREDGHYIRVALYGCGAPLWLCDALSGDVLVDEKYFDQGERTVEEPEWPNPTDGDMHVYQGADGAKYLYMPSSNCDTAPWHRLPFGGYSRWDDADGMISSYPAALPLTELELVPKEEES